MNKKCKVSLFLFTLLMATDPIMKAAESRNQRISRLQSAFQTFRKDMSCLFSRTKKCSREQKQRIAAEAIGLVITVAALTGAGFLWWKKWQEKKTKKPDQQPGKEQNLEKLEQSLRDFVTYIYQEGTGDPKKLNKLATEFLNQGGNPSIIFDTVKGEVPLLFLAIIERDLDLINKLIEKKANINMLVDGFTALHIAANENTYIVQKLLDAGANPLIKTEWGKKPSDLSFDDDIKDMLLKAERKWREEHE